MCSEKSTLMKVLSGVYPFGTIHQALALIPYLSIAENIFLGKLIEFTIRI